MAYFFLNVNISSIKKLETYETSYCIFDVFKMRFLFELTHFIFVDNVQEVSLNNLFHCKTFRKQNRTEQHYNYSPRNYINKNEWNEMRSRSEKQKVLSTIVCIEWIKKSTRGEK